MSHTKNFEPTNAIQKRAVDFQLLATISRSANTTTSTFPLFRDIGRELLSGDMADAVSLMMYDQDATRVTELLLMTGPRDVKRTGFHHMPLGGLSILGTKASDLTELGQPRAMKAPEARDRLFSSGAPLHFFTAYSQQLHIPLVGKGGMIGTLTLHSKWPGRYSDQHLSPFVVIGYHMSLAMRLHESVNERLRVEEERKLLLALGNALTTVKDRKDLTDVMQAQFRTLFPSGDIVICITDQEKQTHSVFLFLPEKDRYPDHSPVTSAEYPIDDGFYKQIQTARGVRIFDIEALIRHRKVPPYIRYLFDNGIREIAGVGLKSGHTSIGSLFVLCDRHQRLIPSQTISMQAASIHLSMAIANLLAAETIPARPPAVTRGAAILAEKTSGMIGSSPAMQKIRQFILQVAASDSTILISGETGTGKELVAKAIHENSTRRHKSMVKVNCAALPAGLIESELFGHEKGSFTDAIDRKIGKFELADNSTLFLDEIGELPPELQVKLLRALQEKEIERIGGTQIIRTDVRIIAATNRCLRKEMQAGRFRSDLFYRLNVLPLVLPPLRERREDIPALAAGFIYKYARKSGTKITGLSANALQELMAYHWPGNIRELEHLIERSMLLNQSPQIMKIDIPSPDTSQMAPNLEKSPDGSFRIRSLEEVERDHILAILKKCNGKVAGEGGAARLLNIPSTTLNGKIRRLGIKKNFIAGLTKAILFFLLTTPILHAAAQQSTEQVFQNTALLHGDSIVFPLTLVNAYPFVSVEVNGIQGKFMFDTGLNGDIEINDNAVYLPGKKPVKKGQVGSGQSFIRNINDTIAEVKFKNGLTYRSLLKITSANFDFLQKNITPDCIGYIGHDFFNGYLFKLDYLRRKLTFYKNTEQRKLSKDFLKGENVLATLDFETRRLPNHPMVHVKIGNVDLLGSFDTSQYGLLQLDDQAAKALKNASLVIPAGNDAYNDTLINVSNIVINGEFTLSVKGIYPLTLEQTAPFRKGMQVTETSYICFGYRFLDQYKTVWDYADKKIYILEK